MQSQRQWVGASAVNHAERPDFLLQLHMAIETLRRTLEIHYTAAGVEKAQFVLLLLVIPKKSAINKKITWDLRSTIAALIIFIRKQRDFVHVTYSLLIFKYISIGYIKTRTNI